MSTYSTARNTSFAAIIVATLAGIVGNTLGINQQLVYERDVPQAVAVAELPEVVVSATRLDW